MKQFWCLIFVYLLFQGYTYAQISFSVSPSKLYFQVPPGESRETTVTVTNGGKEERAYAASFLAWDRTEGGVKQFSPDTGQVYSCARMLSAQPAAFNLLPGQKQIVTISLAHTSLQELPALWAMLMIRELNVGQPAGTAQGVQAVLNIEYQIGVHVYQELPGNTDELELQLDTVYLSQQEGKKEVSIHVKNSSRLIGEARLEVQLFSMDANKATPLPVRSLTLLPEHERIIRVSLPDDLPPGDYTVSASLDPGREYDLVIADFYFSIPPD